MSLQRSIDNSLCGCCKKIIVSNDTACSVAVPVKKWNKLSLKTRNALEFQWDCTRSSNNFHWLCWCRLREEAARQSTRLESIAHNMFSAVDETVERFDGIDSIRQCARICAPLLNASRYTVCFTGAGVSAAAGIPTYRGAEV